MVERKAQGSLEYLLIIGAAILIVSVVIVFLTVFMSESKDKGDSASNAVWSDLDKINDLRSGSASSAQQQTLFVGGLTLPVSNSLTQGVVLSINSATDYSDKSTSGLTVTPHSDICDSCLEIADSLVLDFSGNFSFSVVAKANSLSENYEVIFFKSDPGNWVPSGYGFANYLNVSPSVDNQVNFFIDFYEQNYADSVLSLGAFTHFVGVYDGSQIRLYKNGVLADSFSYSSGLTANNYPLTIGYEIDGPSNGYSIFDGEIKWVSFWNRTLSADEVESLSEGVQSALGN